MTTTITSRKNPIFQRVRDAIRDHRDEIVIEGPKMVADAIAAGWLPLLLVQSSGAKPLAGAANVEFTSGLFDAVSDLHTSQGVLAIFARPPQRNVFARRDSIVVALDGVQDPGNVGTIIRLAAAFDASGVALLPGCADPFGPKAIRASAGAVLSIAIANLEAIHGNLFAADGTGAIVDPPSRDAVLIFGSEGAGVSEELRRRSKRIAIHMSDRVESLNVAAAAAILLSRSYALRNQ